jgi:hypothetical protein
MMFSERKAVAANAAAVFFRGNLGSPILLAALAMLALGTCMLALAPRADGLETTRTTLANGVQRVNYVVGPIEVTPGQNRIAYRPILGEERPSGDGWITRLKPDLVYENGEVPRSDKVMFHHGVWLSLFDQDATAPVPERFFATGEEKTRMDLPDGYGYAYEAEDVWILNHMIHNLTPEPMSLYMTYELDFIPADSPAAADIKPVRPIWMDVDNGSIYPVFDVAKGSGGKDGKFVYPDDAEDPYTDGNVKNQWAVDRDGVLVSATGHVHTGGLSTDLNVIRQGARYAGPKCANKKPRERRMKCKRKKPTVTGNKAHIFESRAHYFEPAGPVSWDVAMVSTKPDWRVAVKKGDILEQTTTYETKIASWYESMGLTIVYMADEGAGKNPFKTKVDGPGVLNHGHLDENNVHGGKKPVVGPDPRKLPGVTAVNSPEDPFQIAGFSYEAGNFRIPGSSGRPPKVEQGSSLTFSLGANDDSQGIWHSLTSCAAPCNRSTGIAYPLADARFQFDSGQLGTGGPPTVERTTWTTPPDLPVGTHTYFCRIHPLMRGAFRVVKRQ